MCEIKVEQHSLKSLMPLCLSGEKTQVIELLLQIIKYLHLYIN